ncbi:heparinase II/III domain-containing protein [Colwellia ponticola]|uniref:Heparinase II/III-like C-terminal domain-containing protein n=1 Tax=Colwellia ponticola TaxID=2304625 RepID=A0A8H2JKY0_9GAMM|nr:heparinase II/III family protein [Colwellia ponticola]TMM45268.1 hypothetical protein FCS21_09255 [Colwellia ponticola]
MKLLKIYIFCVGIIAHIALLVGGYVLMNKYNLSLQYIFNRGLVSIKDKSPYVKELLAPTTIYPDYQPVAKFNSNTPRILSQVEKLLNGHLHNSDFGKNKLKRYFPCYNQGLPGKLSCWIYKRDSDSKRALKKEILGLKLDLSNKNSFYGNGWELAFAYDAVKNTDILTVAERTLIEKKLLKAIGYYLSVLNDNSVSLWHGRAEITAQLWLSYIAILDPPKAIQADVESHFSELIKALELAPAWPEGFNYWINSRALSITLALSSFVNGTGDSVLKNRVLKTLNDIGYWHIYATRPDISIEPIGDEGARIDLKDETRRVIDIIAQTTKNKDFSQFSQLLEKKHGLESYYRSYRWGYYLFHNPKLDTNLVTSDTLSMFQYLLPEARTFGEKYYGLSFIRENWLPDGTFMNFKAGDVFTHHAHYDAGHFTLFKGKPLIVNSSVYGSFFGENRLNYSIRTISKNSIIIQKNNESVKVNRFFKKNVADGGQRIVLPTGSAIQSVSQWYEKRVSTPMLIGGSILSSSFTESYAFIKADLTKAYNSTWYDENDEEGKVSTTERTFFYLREEDILFISDSVDTINPKYTVKSILHMVNKPLVDNLNVLVGTENNGILSSESTSFKVENSEAKLVGTIFNASKMRIIGGSDYKFYVEADGDDTTFNGENYTEGVTDRLDQKSASWRLEAISDEVKSKHEMITVLQPSIGSFREDTVVKKQAEGAYLIETEKSIILISNAQSNIVVKNITPQKKIYIMGLDVKAEYTFHVDEMPVMNIQGGIIEIPHQDKRVNISITKH